MWRRRPLSGWHSGLHRYRLVYPDNPDMPGPGASWMIFTVWSRAAPDLLEKRILDGCPPELDNEQFYRFAAAHFAGGRPLLMESILARLPDPEKRDQVASGLFFNVNDEVLAMFSRSPLLGEEVRKNAAAMQVHRIQEGR